MRPLRIPTSEASRLYDWLRGSSAGLGALALVVGLGAGLGAVVFRELIALFTLVFTGSRDYAGTPGAAYPLAPALGPWFLVAVPVVGGLLYGPLIDRFAREARGHGVPEVMLAVTTQGGRIRPRVAVVKSLASAVCLGAGGSVGREGPIVQIGSALGSAMGQRLRMSEANLRLLVACGAAGGISATFNAPIAGVFFALELILRDFEARSFGTVVLASVTADIVGQHAFGSGAFLQLPAFQITSIWEYPLYMALGLPAALVGVGFIRTLYGAEDVADRIWKGRPEWARPAVGGVLLGLLLLVLPQLYGVGYPPLEKAEMGDYAVAFLLVLLVGKLAATSLTIAIGGSGGVFAPSLFMGAMLGTAFGLLANQLAPGIAGPAGAYGLVGMGAVFAAAARAPITSVLIMFELTGDYRIILPLMLAVAISAGISSLLTRDTIYTLKLRRRGVEVRSGRSANLMELITVGEAMSPVPEAVPESATLGEFVERFVVEGRQALPVADASGAYRGVLTMQQIEESMRDNAFGSTAGRLAEQRPTLRPQSPLEEALTMLVRHESAGLPVVSPDGKRVLGWLTHQDVMRAYVHRLDTAVTQVADGLPRSGMASRGESRAGTAVGAEPAGKSEPAAAVESRERASNLLGYRVVDLELSGDGAPVGWRVDQVDWLPLSLPIGIRRDGESLQPKPGTVLQKGDRLTILAPEQVADEYWDALAARLNRPVSRARPTAGRNAAGKSAAGKSGKARTRPESMTGRGARSTDTAAPTDSARSG
jgi:CIC family chloride channel protein